MLRGSLRISRLDPVTHVITNHLHQQAVVVPPVATALVLAHHPYGPKADLLVAADRMVIRCGRIDGDSVMAAPLEQEPGEQVDRLRTGAVALMAGAQVYVDPGVSVHRVVLFVVLNASGDLPVDFHHQEDA